MSVVTINAGYILPVKTEPIKKGSISISDDGTIHSIGHYEGKSKGDDLLLIPGLVNAHTHLELTDMPHPLSVNNFTGWAHEVIEWRKNQSDLSINSSVKKGVERLLHSGVTCFGDYSTTGNSHGELSSRGLKGRVFIEFTGFKTNLTDLRLDDVKKKITTLKNNLLCSSGIAPHAPYSVSPSLFRKSFQLASQLDMPYSTHLAEHEDEEELIAGKGGPLKKFMQSLGVWDENWISPDTTPVRYMRNLGLLNKLIGVHLNRVDNEEIDILKENNCSVIFCPGSTLWFGRTIYCPVSDMVKRGITVALGTDSSASNHELSMLGEMRLVKKMFPSLTFKKILEMATIDGAKALGLDKVAGFFMEGIDADIVGIKMDQAYSSPYEALFSNKCAVQFVMLKGKLVFGKI